VGPVTGALLLSFVRGLAWPLLGATINASIMEDSVRVTTLSLFSGLCKLTMAICTALVGFALENNDENSLAFVCAVCSLVLAALGMATLVTTGVAGPRTQEGAPRKGC